MTCLAFMFLPQGVCVLYVIGRNIIEWRCKYALFTFTLALFYPLVVPLLSIYWAAKELFWGEEEGKLPIMKRWKIPQKMTKRWILFELIGQYFLFSIL